MFVSKKSCPSELSVLSKIRARRQRPQNRFVRSSCFHNYQLHKFGASVKQCPRPYPLSKLTHDFSRSSLTTRTSFPVAFLAEEILTHLVLLYFTTYSLFVWSKFYVVSQSRLTTIYGNIGHLSRLPILLILPCRKVGTYVFTTQVIARFRKLPTANSFLMWSE